MRIWFFSDQRNEINAWWRKNQIITKALSHSLPFHPWKGIWVFSFVALSSLKHIQINMTSRVERCGGCGRQLWLPPQAVAARCYACRSVTSFPSSSQRWAQVYGSVSQPHHNVVTTVPSNYVAAGPGNGKYPRQGCNNYYIDQPRPAWAPPPVYGRKKALLCGVTYNDTNYMLTGSINDVKSMWFLLVRMLGFPSDCVVILTGINCSLLS